MAITRQSTILAVGSSDTELLAVESGEDCVVVSLIIGNVDGTNAATVILTLTKNGEAGVNIVSALEVAAGEAVEFFIGGKASLFLESGDVLSATASAAGDLTATLSWLSET